MLFDEKVIDHLLRDLDQSVLPGAAVGIAVGGVPVYRKGFGLASMELPVTLTPQTRLRIYSITKHFTCLAYLLLCEQGKAGIDDPVGKYLPELHHLTRRVTIRQLMSHTSGLRDACDISWFFSGIERPVSAPDLLTLYQEGQDVNFPPGQAWCYNNGGYHILSAVIERIAGATLEEVFRARIFEPAGMHDTLLRRVDTDFVSNSATMHLLRPDKKYERRSLPGELVGEGGIVSTVDDMLLWMRNIAKPAIGRPDSWALIRTAQKLNNGAETGYGLGLIRRPYQGMDALWHAGGGLGCNAQMIRVPSADLDVIVLVNRSDVSALDVAAKILDACLGVERGRVGTDGRCINGLFRSSVTGQVVELYGREGLQMAAIDGAEEVRVTRTSAQELAPQSHSCWPFAISWRDDTQEPARIRYECYGSTDHLEEIRRDSANSLVPIAGDYRAETIKAQLSVMQDSDGWNLVTTGKFGSRAYRLEGMAPRVWRMRSADGTGWSGIIAAEANSDVLRVRTSASWQLAFRRSA